MCLKCSPSDPHVTFPRAHKLFWALFVVSIVSVVTGCMIIAFVDSLPKP